MTMTSGKLIETTYNLGLKNETLPQQYYFGIGARNGVVIGLAGACKGEKRKLSIPSYLMSRDSETFGDTVIYDAIVADHILAEDKDKLTEFWSMDWNSDKYIDLEEIDAALSRDGLLQNLLKNSSGIENMSDLIIAMFDKNGDDALDRDEFFEMHKTIHISKPEEPPKTVKEPESKRRRRKKDEL